MGKGDRRCPRQKGPRQRGAPTPAAAVTCALWPSLVPRRPGGCPRLGLSDALLLVPVTQEQRPLVPTVVSAVPRQPVGPQGGQGHVAGEADLVPGRGPGRVPPPVVHAHAHADLRRGQGLQAALGLGLVPLQVRLLIAVKQKPQTM